LHCIPFPISILSHHRIPPNHPSSIIIIPPIIITTIIIIPISPLIPSIIIRISHIIPKPLHIPDLLPGPIRDILRRVHNILIPILNPITDIVEAILDSVAESVEAVGDVVGDALDFADFFAGPAGCVFRGVGEGVFEAVFVFVEGLVCGEMLVFLSEEGRKVERRETYEVHDPRASTALQQADHPRHPWRRT
jgi:hypothetical protein